MSKDIKKLHLGCGKNILNGWINLDFATTEGVDIVANLDECKTTKLPFEDNSIDEFLGNHVVEADRHQGETPEEIIWQVHTFRNIVKEMVVELRAIKPIREQKKELHIPPKIEIIQS